MPRAPPASCSQGVRGWQATRRSDGNPAGQARLLSPQTCPHGGLVFPSVNGGSAPNACDTMPNVHHAAQQLHLKIVYYGPGLGGKTTNLEFIHRHSRPERRGKLISLMTESERTLF